MFFENFFSKNQKKEIFEFCFQEQKTMIFENFFFERTKKRRFLKFVFQEQKTMNFENFFSQAQKTKIFEDIFLMTKRQKFFNFFFSRTKRQMLLRIFFLKDQKTKIFENFLKDMGSEEFFSQGEEMWVSKNFFSSEMCVSNNFCSRSNEPLKTFSKLIFLILSVFSEQKTPCRVSPCFDEDQFCKNFFQPQLEIIGDLCSDLASCPWGISHEVLDTGKIYETYNLKLNFLDSYYVDSFGVISHINERFRGN